MVGGRPSHGSLKPLHWSENRGIEYQAPTEGGREGREGGRGGEPNATSCGFSTGPSSKLINLTCIHGL